MSWEMWESLGSFRLLPLPLPLLFPLPFPLSLPVTDLSHHSMGCVLLRMFSFTWSDLSGSSSTWGTAQSPLPTTPVPGAGGERTPALPRSPCQSSPHPLRTLHQQPVAQQDTQGCQEKKSVSVYECHGATGLIFPPVTDLTPQDLKGLRISGWGRVKFLLSSWQWLCFGLELEQCW